LNPVARQADLISAVEPVANRVVHAFNAAKQAWVVATAQGDERAVADAKDHMDALTLFKGDMTTFQRLYSFLSQILDYGNTEIEKRAIFYRRLLPLLEFGREREGIDLSGVKLTHHSLKAEAKRNLLYGEGDAPKLDGMSDVGSGSLQEKEKARLDETRYDGWPACHCLIVIPQQAARRVNWNVAFFAILSGQVMPALKED